MPLYLVNARHNQDCRFFYRLPEVQSAAPAYIDIKMGEQRQLPEPVGGLSEPAIQEIVEANVRFGMVEAGVGLPRDKYVPMLWSRRPISEKVILSAVEHNQIVSREGTHRRLDATAVQIADAIDDGLHRSQHPERLRALEAVVQEVGSGAEADDAVRVTRTPAQRDQVEHKRRNSRRRASE